MSKLGKKPIPIPKDTKVKVRKWKVNIKWTQRFKRIDNK